MATKSKAKKPAPKKRATKKPAAKKQTAAKKKPARKRAAPKPPPITVPNHPFAPGSTVGFHPRSAVTVEKGMGREPFPAPLFTAEVATDGTLAVSGLHAGPWTAAAEVGERWRYYDFPVGV